MVSGSFPMNHRHHHHSRHPSAAMQVARMVAATVSPIVNIAACADTVVWNMDTNEAE
jgi:hypothetical protein